MKLLVLTHTIPRFSGDPSAPFIEILCNAISKQVDKVFVLAPYDSEMNKKYKREFKLLTFKYIFPNKLHVLGYSRTLIGDKSMSLFAYTLSPFLYLFGFLNLIKIIKDKKIDIVSAHWIIPNGFIAALASRITGVPFTVTIPGSDIYMASKNTLFKWMAGIASKCASNVISDSSHYLKQLNDLGYFPKNTSVIRYGVDTKKFVPTKKDSALMKSLQISPNDPVVLSVGRMVAKKGFKYLVKAIPKIIEKIPKVKFVLVGDGELREELEREVVRSGSSKNVIFVGTVSYNELSKYYNMADVFVMPSIKDEKGNIDASPVAMMEAMACGARVVATKFSGSDDLIEPGETGFLVKEKDSKEISNSVITLIKRSTLELNRKKVRQIAVKNFSSLSIASRYIDIFKETKK